MFPKALHSSMVVGPLCLIAAHVLAAPGNVDLPRYPSINPDGSTILFSWRGDLWSVSSDGGVAMRLTSHPADDLRSAFSRDGKRIAFDSNRSGDLNIFVMNADGTAVSQLTSIDVACTLSSFGVDAAGEPAVFFSAALEGDLYRSPRPFMISTNGGDMLRAHDAFGAEPAASPDGKRIVFTRGGSAWERRNYRGPDNRNVWLFDRNANSFTQLTSFDGNDGKARFAGENTILFLSDRDLSRVNLYSMNAREGQSSARRLTSFDQADVWDFDVSADGSVAVVQTWDMLYRVNLKDANAQPAALAISANEDEMDNFQVKSIDREASEAALSPDGKVMALVAYGEVYVRNIEEKHPTRRITSTHAREKQIAWSPDGLKLYFVSDSDGNDSIFEATVAMTRKEVKDSFDAAVKPPEPEPPASAPASAPETAPATAPQSQPAATSPETAPSTAPSTAPQSQPETAEEKAARKEKEKKLDAGRWQDAITFTIEPIVAETTDDRAPSPSPDGKSLAFRRGRGDLIILDLTSKESRALATGWDTSIDWRWSPDSRHIAYAQNDMNFNGDIWIVPADGSAAAVNVTRHPDSEDQPRWSADGKILAFISERVNEESDVWMVYLDKELESYTGQELDKYYKDAAETAKKRKPLSTKPDKKDGEKDKSKGDEKTGDEKKDDAKEAKAEEKSDDSNKDEKKDEKKEPKPLDLDDAWLRLRRVTTMIGNEGNLELTPGGDRYIFTAENSGNAELVSIKWDGTDRKRLAEGVNVQHVTLTGDKVVFVNAGRGGTVGPAGGEVAYVDISDRMRIDLQAQASQKFLEAARILGEQFYHPTMKDLDWPALAQKYHALARQSRTADEFNYIANRMIGELNASHLGISASSPPSPNRQPFGRLGTIHRRVADGFEVVRVIPQTPAAKGPRSLKPGDVITAIDLQPLEPGETLESRLQGRIGQEVIISFRRVEVVPTQPAAPVLGAGAQPRALELQTIITPISFGEERQLKYLDWRQGTAELVAKLSNGRIGYIHIAGMDEPSLDVFERDLYAAANDKQGLIIDVRNNGGGWTADRLLSSIMVQQHAYTIPRGADPGDIGHYPQDRLFIQRYTLPIDMLCNEKSFSNAEIISHAFKTLKRGTLVGQQTYGGVISTGGTSLIDGTFVRLPFRGWYLPDGTDMENHGARPDIIVAQTPEAESRDDDEQVKAAVEDLLKRVK